MKKTTKKFRRTARAEAERLVLNVDRIEELLFREAQRAGSTQVGGLLSLTIAAKLFHDASRRQFLKMAASIWDRARHKEEIRKLDGKKKP